MGINQSFIKAQIVGHNKQNAVFYSIELQVQEQELKTWQIQRRYSTIYQFREQIVKLFPKVPKMPKKTVVSPSKLVKIEQRKAHLSQFLSEIVKRQDIMTSQLAIQFFEIDKNCPDLTIQVPLCLNDMQTQFPIVDFFFEPEQKILVLATTTLNAGSKTLHSIQNVYWPWQDKSQKIKKPVSEVIIYQTSSESQQNQQDKVVFKAFFKLQLCAVHWDPALSLLTVGLEDGHISIFQIDLSSEAIQEGMPQMGPLYNIEQTLMLKNVASQRHTKEDIIAVDVDSELNQIISISKDKNLHIIDLKDLNLLGRTPVEHEQLSSLFVDQQKHCAFVGSKSGIVCMIDVSKQTPQLISKFSVFTEQSISCIFYDTETNYIFIASENCFAAVFQQVQGESQPVKVIEYQTRAKNYAIC